MVMFEGKDLTWPVCSGCIFRVKRLVRGAQFINGREVEDFVEYDYVCSLGMDRDRNPDICPKKIKGEAKTL